jgi:hypothetical protein
MIMSGSSAEAASDLEFVERFSDSIVDRRYETRLVVRIPGRFSLASRRDSRGNRRQFACRAVNISQSSIMLAASVKGPLGERVISYFEEFGKIQGPIVRVLDLGFVMRITASDDDRSKLLRKLIWLEQNKNCDVPDVRTHARVVPQDPISTLVFADGSALGCFVIDMSGSGAAVSADIMPEIGTVLAVGQVVGTVVRHFAEGFAVKFKRVQNPYNLEKLVVHKS